MPNLYPEPSCSPVCSFNGIDHLTSDVLLDGWTQKWLSHSLRLMSNKVLIRWHAVACSAAAGPVTLLLRAVPVLLYRADFHDCIAHTGSISACVLTVTCPPLQACHVGTFGHIGRFSCLLADTLQLQAYDLTSIQCMLAWPA